MAYPEHMEQGACAECGSYEVRATNLMGGRPGENILAFFACEECGCRFVEVYEYTIKGIVERGEE